jgi:hypothetical protein
MCIIYFASHHGCDHHHFLGAWNCGINCPTDGRHTLHLNNNGYDCQTCVFLGSVELDPDIIPVEYYPPLFDTDKLKEAHGKEEERGDKDYVASAASLSDPDSLTSEWRYDPSTAPQHDSYLTPLEHETNPTVLNHTLSSPVTPKTAAHRNLVQNQLNNLPHTRQARRLRIQPPLWHSHVPSLFEPVKGMAAFRVVGSNDDERKKRV